MKLTMGALVVFLMLAQFCGAQTNVNSNGAGTERVASVMESFTDSYAIMDASPAQEAALRQQIRLMHPAVLPLRVFFVPHWKYLEAARTFQLHVPAGYGSLMFTHLPSRTIFIDNDRYQDERWLGYWIAHELGHLAKNSATETTPKKPLANSASASKIRRIRA
jgi:hypothetical protein